MKNKAISIYTTLFAIVSARRRLPIFQQWGLLLIGLLFSVQVFARNPLLVDTIALSQLPAEAQQTLVLIKQNGPFPYKKDGVVFGNYEGLLPKQKRGYYHEFTVKTPRARNRGARRIISGGMVNASSEYYYTDDHYSSFKRIRE